MYHVIGGLTTGHTLLTTVNARTLAIPTLTTRASFHFGHISSGQLLVSFANVD